MTTLRILNLGAGVQSTALYLMAMRQDEPEIMPKIDRAVFADTQEEPRSVYDHILWLQSLGGPPILIDTAGRLGDNLISGIDLSGSRFVSIPMFIKSDRQDREGRTKRQCTRDFKINVIERTIRRDIIGLRWKQHMPDDIHVEQYIGLSYDEPRRVARTKARYVGKKGFVPCFPLWDWGWSRRDCESYLNDVAPGRRFAKSACVFCPFHSNENWRDQRNNDPEAWQRSIEIDRAIREHGSRCNQRLRSTGYLHRSCVPLEDAMIDDDDGSAGVVEEECEGVCGG